MAMELPPIIPLARIRQDSFSLIATVYGLASIAGLSSVLKISTLGNFSGVVLDATAGTIEIDIGAQAAGTYDYSFVIDPGGDGERTLAEGTLTLQERRVP